jgi:hypothetical protein
VSPGPRTNGPGKRIQIRVGFSPRFSIHSCVGRVSDAPTGPELVRAGRGSTPTGVAGRVVPGAGVTLEGAMVAILDGGRCPSCGGRHTLYLPDHRMAWLHRDFDYN